ncbi:MAG TPA: hypothetical protein VIU14_13905 [Mesorhizobium sp.]
MDWNLANEKDRGALQRIVAMCLALAALAERASSLSGPVRCLLLWILRPAESAAREFVMELMQAPLPANAEFAAVRSGDSSSDAKRLALCFQAMARALDKFMWTSLYFARAGVSPSKDLARNRDRKHPRTMLDMVEAYPQATVLCAMERCDSS